MIIGSQLQSEMKGLLFFMPFLQRDVMGRMTSSGADYRPRGVQGEGFRVAARTQLQLLIESSSGRKS